MPIKKQIINYQQFKNLDYENRIHIYHEQNLMLRHEINNSQNINENIQNLISIQYITTKLNLKTYYNSVIEAIITTLRHRQINTVQLSNQIEHLTNGLNLIKSSQLKYRYERFEFWFERIAILEMYEQCEHQKQNDFKYMDRLNQIKDINKMFELIYPQALKSDDQLLYGVKSILKFEKEYNQLIENWLSQRLVPKYNFAFQNGDLEFQF